MFFGQFFEKWVSVRERNIKLLLETVTYITITETSTYMITTKIVTHIFVEETIACINAAGTSNSIISTVACTIATERSTSITVIESTICIIAMEPQDLHNWKRRCHLHNCYRRCQLHGSNRNCYLQN